MSMDTRARVVAFYLPQFHPIPENDAWWGPGFTEWRNVAAARPLFDGHEQPHVPGTLGYYDLRVPEVREAQAELAAAHGVEAFCYWHYWFRGKRLLGRPLDDVLASGRPDHGFCLAWANESWTRTWLGDGKQILQSQDYSPEDDLRHARWLAEAFADPRYLRIFDRPVFLIYRPADLPSPERTTDVLRSESVRLGLAEPLLLGVTLHSNLDYSTRGFDGTVAFEPMLGMMPETDTMHVSGNASGVAIYDYDEVRRRMPLITSTRPVYRTIVVSWDNSPRRGTRAIVFVNSGPERFRAGLQELVAGVEDQPFEERLVFVNAWNEWAEGNHLEPDRRHGTGYLEAVRSVNVAVPARRAGTSPRA